MNEWFIKLFRSLLEWEWYDDINVKILFIHLLLKANFKDKKWRWIEIKKWELLTSNQNLALETQLSLQQVRTCLKKLKSTWEITHRTTNNYTLIKLNNYDKYNLNNTQVNNQITDKQHSNNRQATTTKERKESKKDNNIIKEKNIKKEKINFSLSQKKSFLDLLKTEIIENENFIQNLKNKFNLENESLKSSAENFLIYWTEKNPNWKKEKWEMEKTFDIQRRFYKWIQNNQKWNTKPDKTQTHSYESVF